MVVVIQPMYDIYRIFILIRLSCLFQRFTNQVYYIAYVNLFLPYRPDVVCGEQGALDNGGSGVVVGGRRGGEADGPGGVGRKAARLEKTGGF